MGLVYKANQIREAFTTKYGNTWYEVVKAECPVCGSIGGCMISSNLHAVACKNISSDKVVTKSPLLTYWHSVQNYEIVGTNPSNSKKSNKKGYTNNSVEATKITLDAGQLNKVYSVVLSTLTLSDKHHEHLKLIRGLDDKAIEQLGYVSFPEESINWNQVFRDNHLKADCWKGIPGFFEFGGKVQLSGEKGILIPFRNENGQILAFQEMLDLSTNNINVKMIPDKSDGVYRELVTAGEIVCENDVLKRIRMHRNFGTVEAYVDSLFREAKNKGLFQIDYDWDEENKKVNYKLHSSIVLCSEVIEDMEGSTDLGVSIKWGSVFLTFTRGAKYKWISSKTNKVETVPHVSVPLARLVEAENQEMKYQPEIAYITEGGLKADLFEYQLQKKYNTYKNGVKEAVIAVAGVGEYENAYRKAVELGVKKVVIAFDADYKRNEHVKDFRAKLIQLCVKDSNISTVIELDWDITEGKGIDDLLTNGKKPNFTYAKST